MAAKRESSPMAVDDPRSVEVVRRDLHAHAITREDADAEAPHLARHVAEDLVTVVELHPEHGVRERFDHLTLELDLLFLRQNLYDPDVRGLWALRALAELVLDLGALGQRAEPVTRDRREVDERVLAPIVGGDESEALLVAEPLHDTGSHQTETPRCPACEGHSLPAYHHRRPGDGPDRASCTSQGGACQPSPGACVPPAAPSVGGG